MKVNMLPPSVNNMSVRVAVRAMGLDVEEENVWGQTQSPEYLAKFPAGLTPSIESDELAKGGLWESCAVMMYLASREGREDLYPASDLARRAMVDAANFYTMSILYPLVTRATYPRLSFPGYPGEVSTSEASDEDKEAARKAAEESLSRVLQVYPDFFFTEAGFIGGDSPTVADIRFACTLEFLAVADEDLPGWAKEYMQRVESALGDAYSEPAADVRGYITQATAEPVAT